MENNEKKMKHLEMIEGVIDRMGSNSFQLKGWAVTLVALVGALSAQGSDKRFILIAFIPLIAFWFLDAYYLQMERKYEIIYKCVSEKSESEIDFSMDTHTNVYDDNSAKRVCFCNCLFSKTEAPFYIIIAVSVGILALVLILT